MAGDQQAAKWCAEHQPAGATGGDGWPWSVPALAAGYEAATQHDAGAFVYGRTVADELAKLPQAATLALHRGFHELEDRGALHANVSTMTTEQLKAACRTHDDAWEGVCAAVARLFKGCGNRQDLRDLLNGIAGIGHWQRELTRQYYDHAPECSGNPETRAEREREFDALLARLDGEETA
jgi:hypothetical protein